MSRREGLTRAALLLAVIAAATAFFELYAWERMNDFRVYYKAAERILEGQNIYTTAEGFYQYKYTPLLAVAMTPLTLLPQKAAGLSWLILNALLLVACVRQVQALVPGVSGRWIRLALPLAFFHHVTRELELGQVNLICFFLLLRVIRSPQGRWAGALLAAATLIKPVYAIFALVWLLGRDHRRLAYYALGLAAGLALALPFWGGDALEYYRIGLANLSDSTWIAVRSPDNQSLWGVAFRFFSSHGEYPALVYDLGSTLPLKWCVGALCLAVLGAQVYLTRSLYGAPADPPDRPAAMELCNYSLFITLMLLFSPLGWHYTQLQLLLPLFLLYDRDPRFRQLAPVYLLILFSIVLPFELLRRTLYYGLLIIGTKTAGVTLIWWRLLRLRGEVTGRSESPAPARLSCADGEPG